MKPWQAEPSIRLLNFRKWIRTVKPNGILVVCTKFSYYKPRHINFLLLLAKEIPKIDLLMLFSRFYPGVPDALKFASSRLYIVTTKQVWYISLSFFLPLFFDKGDTTFGIRAIPMPHVSVLDWPSYLSRHKLASFILRKCKCFFSCVIYCSLFPISEPICRCFTARACRSNNTAWKNIWPWNWVTKSFLSMA